MTISCPYCDYQTADIKLSLDILRLLINEAMPIEDKNLWMNRLVSRLDKGYFKAHDGVKVHIGRMHKVLPNLPQVMLSEDEANVFKEVAHAR